MTAAAETGMADRTAAAVTLASDVSAQRGEISAMIGAVARWGRDAIAKGKPPKWVAYQMIDAGLLIAAEPPQCRCTDTVVATLEETLDCPYAWLEKPGTGWVHTRWLRDPGGAR